MTDRNTAPPAEFAPIELKDPFWAAILAWLVPGAGHVYQGRFAKGVIFFLGIFGLSAIGLVLGSAPHDERVGYGRVVYVDTQNLMERMAFFPQAGVGALAIPAIFQATNGNAGQGATFMMPMRGADADYVHYVLGPYFELGTVYTMIAGLLNILAIYDAACGPVIVIDDRKRRKRGQADDTDDDDASESDAAESEPAVATESN